MKITFERRYNERYGRDEYLFTGARRQPTVNEILDFIKDENLWRQIEWPGYMILGLPVDEDAFCGCGWGDEYDEPSKTVVFQSWHGGEGEGSCPVCGHERDMGGTRCPVCWKPWDDMG